MLFIDRRHHGSIFWALVGFWKKCSDFFICEGKIWKWYAFTFFLLMLGTWNLRTATRKTCLQHCAKISASYLGYKYMKNWLMSVFALMTLEIWSPISTSQIDKKSTFLQPKFIITKWLIGSLSKMMWKEHQTLESNDLLHTRSVIDWSKLIISTYIWGYIGEIIIRRKDFSCKKNFRCFFLGSYGCTHLLLCTRLSV